MLFLPKALGLRFQLLVALLLALGTVSEGEEGKKLKCFQCLKLEDLESCTKGQDITAQICKTGEPCYKATKGKETFRSCHPDVWLGKCFKKVYGDKCVTIKSKQESDDFKQKLDKACPGDNRNSNNLLRLLEERVSDADSAITLCFCDTHLCNPAAHSTPGIRLLTSAIILSGATAVYSYHGVM